MNEDFSAVHQFFTKYVLGTKKDSAVAIRRVLVCHLTEAVAAAIGARVAQVWVTARAIKHLYDKRPAQEFDVILRKGYLIVMYPDKIYKNLDQKRGEYGFVKKIGAELYFCSIEIERGKNFTIATVFRLSKPKAYLKNYKSLWGWRGGKSSS